MSTMNPERLSADWRKWLRDNVARGCSAESMHSAMCAGGIDSALAAAEIRRALGNAAPALPPQVVSVPTEAALNPVAAAASSGVYQYEAPRPTLQGNCLDLGDRRVTVSARLERPQILVLDNLLSAEECEQLIELATPRLKRSTIIDPGSGAEEVIGARTSSGMYFPRQDNELVSRLEARLARLTGIAVENGEGIQVLNYLQAAEYRPHYDYFPPQDPGSAVHLAKGGQRVATIVMYLNDVEAGGGTIFPELGMTVTPRRGAAVYFEYCNSLGQVDPATLHGGAPVAAGEKWIATKWLRQRVYA